MFDFILKHLFASMDQVQIQEFKSLETEGWKGTEGWKVTEGWKG